MARRPRVLLALLVVVPVLVLAPAAPAQACSCATDSVRGSAADADVVATGRVSEVGGDPLGLGRDVALEVDVERVWVGDLTARAEVVTDGPDSSCGLGAREGDDYVFFLFRDGGDLRTDLCSTRPRTDRYVERVVRSLGPGEEPAPGGGEAGASAPGGVAAVVAAVLVVGAGALGGAMLVRRRRPRG